MDEWIAILLPFALIMARATGFIFVSPIFSWPAIPAVIRVGLVVLLTVFFGIITPRSVPSAVNWVWAVVLMMQESLVGLALGLAARLIYLAVGQGGIIAAQQMGFTDAEVFDPTNEVESQPIAMLFEIIFLLLFFSAGGHRLLLGVLNSSLYSFPVASLPDLASLTEGIVQAGSAMLLFALKLAAPMLAGFLLVGVLLCILARVLPEMDILMSSFPLRVGAGLLLAGMIMPLMNAFTQELAQWMGNFLAI